MNLYDLIRRKDASLEIEGAAEALTPRTLAGRPRAVRLDPGAKIRIRDAQALTALASFPTDLQWRILGRFPSGGVKLFAECGNALMALGATRPDLLGRSSALKLNWPVATGAGFDLIIQQIGAKAALLEIGPLFNPRLKLMPLLQGVGVEVGPGLNPQVKPGPNIDVYYVEEKSPEEWRQTYAHNEAKPASPSAEILTRTRQDSATTLDHWPEASLDFVFSNHVFEHLMNPLQVLRNWLSRLRPGGLILGVTPDARYSFDCRQPLSTIGEIRAEAAAGGFSPPDEKYERWVRYTAPMHKVATLKKRSYSIHMHFYTPEIFRQLCEDLRAEGLIDSIFLNTAPNNKDFGFVLRKTS